MPGNVCLNFEVPWEYAMHRLLRNLLFSDSANFAMKTIRVETQERMTLARGGSVLVHVQEVDGSDGARGAKK